VTSGSAAARAGVLIGDKVIAVNSQNVLQSSLDDIRQLIHSGKFSSSLYDVMPLLITN